MFFWTFLTSESKSAKKSIMIYMKNVTSARLKIHQTLRSPTGLILDFKAGVGRNLIFGSVPAQKARFCCGFIVFGHSRGRKLDQTSILHSCFLAESMVFVQDGGCS